VNRFSFLTQQTDQTRLPVALLSGFLGSGKTTLVNALLGDPRMAGTAVAVNEFGEVPLDRDLIDHGADKTVVMANGCLCCNLAGDMEDAVMRLFSRREGGEVPRFQRLIIEPSGLSDPAPIAQAILRNPVMSRAMRLEAIVTTVDSLFGATQLARHPEFGKQVALADRLVLTKTDLAAADAVERLRVSLRDHSPAAPILTASHGAIDAASLFPPAFFDSSPSAPARNRSSLFAESIDPDHLGRHAVVSLFADRPLGWRAFDDWLRRVRIGHAEQLLRVKGMLDIAGVDGPVVVQGVHHVLNAPVELDVWPAGGRQSRLVLIADRATIAAASESWAAALPGMTANNQGSTIAQQGRKTSG
jgi:G3E family GTPase